MRRLILLLEGEVDSLRESAIRMFLILARRNLGPPQLAGIKKIDASLDLLSSCLELQALIIVVIFFSFLF